VGTPRRRKVKGSADKFTLWLITVFGKNEKADLGPEERKDIKRFVKRLKE